jgi:hypothetical protein
MAEDLGNITIRFGDGPGGGGGGGGDAGRQIAMAREAAKSALSGIMSNLPAFGRIVQAGTQGSGVAGVLGAARGAVATSGGGIAATGIAAILAPIGVTAAAALALKSTTNRILDRMSDLAQVSAPMAAQQALNHLAEIQRNIREAQILGPMYEQVSALVREIQDLLQPLFLLIKQALMAIIIPILERVASFLRFLVSQIPAVVAALQLYAQQITSVGGAGGALRSMAAGAAASPTAAGLFTALSWIFPPSTSPSSVSNVLNGIAATLNMFYQSYSQQQSGNMPNQWAIDTLYHLSNMPASNRVYPRRAGGRISVYSQPLPMPGIPRRVP